MSDWQVGDVVRLERPDGTLPYERIAVMTDDDPHGDRAVWWLFPPRDEARPYRLTSFIEGQGPVLLHRRPVAGVSTVEPSTGTTEQDEQPQRCEEFNGPDCPFCRCYRTAGHPGQHINQHGRHFGPSGDTR